MKWSDGIFGPNHIDLRLFLVKYLGPMERIRIHKRSLVTAI